VFYVLKDGANCFNEKRVRELKDILLKISVIGLRKKIFIKYDCRSVQRTVLLYIFANLFENDK